MTNRAEHGVGDGQVMGGVIPEQEETITVSFSDDSVPGLVVFADAGTEVAKEDVKLWSSGDECFQFFI